ncbi:hypothetical protein IFM89_039092 [Coptis chinensis]|uniref:Uncharacterized protein n=1 Tax=Coptis chinensis TaxID=261450 RepID=A0A835M336_9MAGN|nr:hypothetical protein IFM89_039092 [Coptis chinensis]
MLWLRCSLVLKMVWDCAFEHGNAVMGPAFGNTKDCELMMMVGLPASGKTMWAEKWVKEHPEKQHLLLGTNLALDQMKVQGLLRKQNYGERFDRLMDRATEIFNALLARVAKIPRNSIIDQTNVYKSAHKRKLRPFFQYRKIAVVVFPRPDVVKLRAEIANYVLPTSKDMPASDEFFDQVWFPELNREDSQRYLEEMKLTLQSASSLPYSSKSSVQSFASPLIQKANVGLQQNPNSPALQAAYGYLRPQLVMGLAYPGGGLPGQPQYASGQYHSGAVPASYGNYGVNNQNIKISSDGRSPFPGGTTGLYPNSGVVYPYGGPYQTHGIVSSERPNYESRIPSTGSSTGWNNGVVHSYYNTPKTSSSYVSSFGSPSTPLSCSNPVDPCYAVQVPGNPAINIHPQPSSAFSSNYSIPRAPFPYGNPVHPPVALQVPRESAYNPHGHLSSTSDSYCGTPYPTLLPGNVPPTGTQQSGGFFTPPGPRSREGFVFPVERQCLIENALENALCGYYSTATCAAI